MIGSRNLTGRSAEPKHLIEHRAKQFSQLAAPPIAQEGVVIGKWVHQIVAVAPISKIELFLRPEIEQHNPTLLNPKISGRGTAG